MSAHLLPVTVEWLERLPDHTPILVRHSAHTFACCVLVTDAAGRVVLPIGGSGPDLDRLPGSCMLDMSDTLTAAAVAARVVRPMGRQDPDTVQAVLAAVCMEAAPRQVEIITRLARAAMATSPAP